MPDVIQFAAQHPLSWFVSKPRDVGVIVTTRGFVKFELRLVCAIEPYRLSAPHVPVYPHMSDIRIGVPMEIQHSNPLNHVVRGTVMAHTDESERQDIVQSISV